MYTNDQDLRAALANIQNEPTPQSPEQQEAFFQECVAEGEKLAVMGESLFFCQVWVWRYAYSTRTRETG